MATGTYTNFISYLEQQETIYILKLYENPFFASFLLNLLPSNVVAFVLELVYRAINITSLKNTKELSDTIKIIRSLHLLEKKGQNLHLNATFRDSLINGFSILHVQIYFIETDERRNTCISSRMEEILQSIVKPEKLEPFMKSIFKHGGLISEDLEVTHKGFEFLLKTHKNQLWLLIIYGIEILTQIDDERINYIHALIEMCYKKVGRVYTTAFEKKLLIFFQHLGILEMISDNKIFITKNFEMLFENQIASKNKFLIIETNHKVYAYTTSEYELSILSLFCKIEYSMSFLIVGSISEDCINKAFGSGITAKQIVNYLEAYSQQLPTPISELIYIWEVERSRVNIEDAYLYKGFLSAADYKATLAFCNQNGYLIDYDQDKRVIVVKPEAHIFVKDYIKKNIQ